ncbi:hypothetical protein B7C42_07267 [Nocardia cerradoensis]|uniref:Uncharacterized protein n=2 Tax=Nocardiaceae TaxID=85025 RepID=A0A231GVR1_9NOCA|nr:hypothetical protein B7C42_07267 [Nocardia cerradoensis]
MSVSSGSVVGTMTTPIPRPHPSGSSGPRPGVPLPGQHLAGGTAEFADPEKVRAEVAALLAELPGGRRQSGDDADGVDRAGTDLTRRARILEQAHEVLVGALATVDKI